MESENGSRDHLREDNKGKVAYAYTTPNLGDNIDKPRSREAESLKVYVDGRSEYKDNYNL
jgi:hypothetical protein